MQLDRLETINVSINYMKSFAVCHQIIIIIIRFTLIQQFSNHVKHFQFWDRSKNNFQLRQ